jgi:aminopeptidase N
MRAILMDEALDDNMRGELMSLPSETYLFEAMAKGDAKADPGAIHHEREQLKAAMAVTLKRKLESVYARCDAVAYADPAGVGARKVATQVLALMAAGSPENAARMAARQFDKADNMTDRQGALMVLCGLETRLREDRLNAFYERYEDNALVVDKWFTLQALSLHPQVIEHVRELAQHRDFTMSNPNRVRSLFMAFAANPQGFHAEDGSGYRMITDVILKLDPINPQTAARFVSPLGRWRRIEPGRAALMKAELERIVGAKGLSRDTYEQVTRSLGD